MNKERTTLLKELKQSPFTVQAAKDVGLSFYDLQVLLGLKKIIKLERGVYAKQSTKSSDNQEMNIALVHLGEPSCICLLSALYLYGLTDEIPNQTWAYVPYEKFTRQANIKIIRKRNPNWEFGITTFDNMKVTSIERTLIDCLTDKKHFTQLDAIKYTKTALDEELTTIKKLFTMAKKLKVEKRVKLILTMLQENYV